MNYNGSLTEWLSIGNLLWTLFRVVLVWMAFHGAGSLVSISKFVRKYFPLMPAFVSGMLAYLAVALILSTFHILTRTNIAVLVLAGAGIGIIHLYIRIKKFLNTFNLRLEHPLILLPVLLVAYLTVTNLMVAGRPEMNFNDTQVTYLVQPDRWLNEGRIYFIDETSFSAFPVISELLFLFPASLAHDRLDQIIVGQVFSLSMLFALVIASMHILKFKWRWYPAAMIGITGCPYLVLCTHYAKPDALALLFVTLSLCILLQQILRDGNLSDYSAFPVMGLALGTKLTAYLVLIPFMILFLILIKKHGHPFRTLTVCALLTSAIPLIFAVRTIIHTGTLFYPHFPYTPFLNSEWRIPEVNLTYSLFNDRSSHFYNSVGFLRNLLDYFVRWGSSIFLLLVGYFISFRRKLPGTRTVILAAIALYAVASIALFSPSWWGTKYGILLIPFSGLYGLYLMKKIRYGLITATAMSICIYSIYDSPLSPIEHYGHANRLQLMASYAVGEWKVEGYRMLEEQTELKLTLWMNRHLPPYSNILSFYVTKRYFSNHRWMVAWRYPPAMRIHLCDNMEDEVELLTELGVDYVFINYMNPAPFDDENSVEVFKRMGPGNLLDPVLILDNFLLLRFEPDNY